MELKKPLKRLQRKVQERLHDYAEKTRAVKDAVTSAALTPTHQGPTQLEQQDDPPVVARLIVEVRSDGTRTVAQGALEDVHTGERVGVRAQGTTPTQLAASLAKSLFTAPLLARQALRTMKQVPSRTTHVPRPQNMTPPATPQAKAYAKSDAPRPPSPDDQEGDGSVIDVGETPSTSEHGQSR